MERPFERGRLQSMSPVRHLAAVPAESPQHATKVVIAEDHQLMRRSLRRLLERTPGIEVVGEAADLALTAQHVAGHRPDVLVIDMRMPDGSSLQMLRALREQLPGLRVVVLSDQDSPGFAQHALAAGASGYVLKEHADTELPAAVDAAARGEQYVGPIIGSRLSATAATGVPCRRGPESS